MSVLSPLEQEYATRCPALAFQRMQKLVEATFRCPLSMEMDRRMVLFPCGHPIGSKKGQEMVQNISKCYDCGTIITGLAPNLDMENMQSKVIPRLLSQLKDMSNALEALKNEEPASQRASEGVTLHTEQVQPLLVHQVSNDSHPIHTGPFGRFEYYRPWTELTPEERVTAPTEVRRCVIKDMRQKHMFCNVRWIGHDDNTVTMSVFSTNPLAKAYFAEMNIFSQRAKSEFFEGEGKTANPSAQRRQRITFKEGRVVSLDEYQIKTPEHMRLVMKLLSHRENEMIVGKGHCCISNSPAFQFFDRLVTRAENWVLTESECYEFCASGQQRHAQTLAEEARKKSETPLKQFTAEELQHAATAWASRHETERHDASLARELAETYGPLSIQESLGGRVPPQHQSSVQESAKLSTSKSQMKPQIEWISTLLPMDSTSRSKMTGAQLGQIPVAPLISSLHQSGSISSASPTHRPSTSIHLQSVASSSMQGQNPTAGRKT